MRVRPRDGPALEGVLCESRCTDDLLYLWEPHTGPLTSIPTAQLEPFHAEARGAWRYAEPLVAEGIEPAATVYQIGASSIGGVGPHPRLQIQHHIGDPDLPVDVIITAIDGRRDALEGIMEDQRAFMRFRHTGMDRYQLFDQMGNTAAVVIRKRDNLVLLVAVLAWKGFDAVCLHEMHSRVVQYFPDRLSRAPHMWVGQHGSADPADAGPVRQPWHWRMSFLPRHWTVVYTCCGGHSLLPRYSRCCVCLVNVFPRRSFHRPLGGQTQNCAAHCSAPLALSPPWIRTFMVAARPGRMTPASPVDTVIKFIDFTCLPTLSWTPPPRRIIVNVH